MITSRLEKTTAGLLLAGILLAGCGSVVRMTYTCDPSGATLYEPATNKNYGTCPTTLDYPISTEAEASGSCCDLNGLKAIWVSGASASVPSLHVDLGFWRYQFYHFNFDRPRDVPGYDVDANYALALQQNTILSEQAANQATANFLASLARAAQPAPPTAAPVTTTCRPFGGGFQCSTP